MQVSARPSLIPSWKVERCLLIAGLGWKSTFPTKSPSVLLKLGHWVSFLEHVENRSLVDLCEYGGSWNNSFFCGVYLE